MFSKPVTNAKQLLAKSNLLDVFEINSDSVIENYSPSFLQAIDDAFRLLESERLATLMTKSLNQVLTRCSKVLELGNQAKMNLPSHVKKNILDQLVLLAENEPYGVRGGALVVMFSPSPTSPNPIKIGRFPLDSSVVSTFELHLTLQPTRQVKQKLANLIRKLQGKATILEVDEKFVLVKKKLYRSSTSMY